IHLIEQELAIDIHDDKNRLSYSRSVNHLRLFIHRFQQNQYAVLDEEILEVVKKKYAESYEISKKVQVLLMRNFHYQVPNEELGYLSIHIERLRMTK
ncbi:MAG: PRD domain-containing protein, partial [Enterococcus faecalis]|nr:PRD domain-containing protein [Enterococcus faecalis]